MNQPTYMAVFSQHYRQEKVFNYYFQVRTLKTYRVHHKFTPVC